MRHFPTKFVPYEYWMCKSKTAYDTEKRANAARRRHMKRSKRFLRLYQCPLCNKFHLTKKKS